MISIISTHSQRSQHTNLTGWGPGRNFHWNRGLISWFSREENIAHLLIAQDECFQSSDGSISFQQLSNTLRVKKTIFAAFSSTEIENLLAKTLPASWNSYRKSTGSGQPKSTRSPEIQPCIAQSSSQSYTSHLKYRILVLSQVPEMII